MNEKTSRAFKALIMKLELEGRTAELTPEDLQRVKDYESKHGNIEVAMIIQNRTIALKIAESWHGVEVDGEDNEI